MMNSTATMKIRIRDQFLHPLVGWTVKLLHEHWGPQGVFWTNQEGEVVRDYPTLHGRYLVELTHDRYPSTAFILDYDQDHDGLVTVEMPVENLVCYLELPNGQRVAPNTMVRVYRDLEAVDPVSVTQDSQVNAGVRPYGDYTFEVVQERDVYRSDVFRHRSSIGINLPIVHLRAPRHASAVSSPSQA